MEAHSSYVVNLHCRSIFINTFLNIKTVSKLIENFFLLLTCFDAKQFSNDCA